MRCNAHFVVFSFVAVLVVFAQSTKQRGGSTAFASRAWSNSTNICGANITLGQAVVHAVNLSFPGLEAARTAAAVGDLNTACNEIAAYFQNSNTSAWLRIPDVPPGTGRVGGNTDKMVDSDYFFLSGVSTGAVVPRNADGGLDWLNKGPRGDVEFMNCLNRHDSFVNLLKAYRATGNPIYTEYFNDLVVDWVTHLPCPNADNASQSATSSAPTSSAPCVPAGLDGATCSWVPKEQLTQVCVTGTMESPWRSLEMGIRLNAQWPIAFFGFQRAIEFSVSARVLMLLAVAEHNAALLVDGGHPGQGTPNWEMTQWQGLATAAVAFPELRNASQLLRQSLDYLEQLLEKSVYPDGIETEEASGYDMGTARDFFNTMLILQDAQHSPPPLTFVSRVENMMSYGTYASTPLGCLPRNGDSDICGNGFFPEATAYYNRTDWTYVQSNGADGTAPAHVETNGPSSVFPWGGQVIFRSGFDRNATWAWFDVGPYGSSGHGHRDKLTLNVHARGSMLLVDSGRFAYQGDDLSATLHREYSHNTSAHNTVTIDGCDQLATPAIAVQAIDNSTWAIAPDADWAWSNFSAFNGLVGDATHARGVHYQRNHLSSFSSKISESLDGDFFVVADAIWTGGRNRTIQTTWHAHPNSTVSIDQSTLAATVGGVATLTGLPSSVQACVVPAAAGSGSANQRWRSAKVVKGVVRNDSAGVEWQGWFSKTYVDATAAPTLVYEAADVADSPASNPAVFVWLIVPSAGAADCASSMIEVVELAPTNVTVTVSIGGHNRNITVRYAESV